MSDIVEQRRQASNQRGGKPKLWQRRQDAIHEMDARCQMPDQGESESLSDYYRRCLTSFLRQTGDTDAAATYAELLKGGRR